MSVKAGSVQSDPIVSSIVSSIVSLVSFVSSELAISVSPLAVPRVVPNDADDDHVIAAALAANAQLIVSGDKHLLDMEQHQGVRIVRPGAAVRWVTAR